MPCVIRPLRADDRSEWTRLWHAYLEFYETALPETVYETTFARLLGDAPQYALLAEADGLAVGLVHYLFHAHNWHIAPVCYLQDLYVDATARGQGAGRALIEAVYAAADEAGAADTYWTTQHFNTGARQLYDRVGRLTPFIKYARGAKA